MKKLLAIALTMFLLTMGSILVGGYLQKHQNTATPPSTNLPTSSPTVNSSNPASSNTTSDSSSKTYTAVDVAKHNATNDCWLIIASKVYNVTNFISQHPGGADRIIAYCGKDATTAFNTQDGEGSHSSSAKSMLAEHLIGSLQ